MSTACEICGSATGLKLAKYCPEHRAARRHKRSKWVPTPKIDALITEAWQDPVLHGKAAGKWVAEKIGWPVWMVKRRARILGLVRRQKKAPTWSTYEISILEKFGWMSAQRIVMKLAAMCGTRRTESAVILKRKRLLLFRGTFDGYSAQTLGQLFGVDVHKVTRWIRRGVLKAERRTREALGSAIYFSGTGAEKDTYFIPRQAVYEFVLGYPDEIDLCKVEKMWFLEMITNGKITADKDASLRRKTG